MSSHFIWTHHWNHPINFRNYAVVSTYNCFNAFHLYLIHPFMCSEKFHYKINLLAFLFLWKLYLICILHIRLHSLEGKQRNFLKKFTSKSNLYKRYKIYLMAHRIFINNKKNSIKFILNIAKEMSATINFNGAQSIRFFFRISVDNAKLKISSSLPLTAIFVHKLFEASNILPINSRKRET